MITCLSGQPDTGKSTLATGIILDYLRQGRRVVANYAVDCAPASLSHKDNLAAEFVEVIPARPPLKSSKLSAWGGSGKINLAVKNAPDCS